MFYVFIFYLLKLAEKRLIAKDASALQKTINPSYQHYSMHLIRVNISALQKEAPQRMYTDKVHRDKQAATPMDGNRI